MTFKKLVSSLLTLLFLHTQVPVAFSQVGQWRTAEPVGPAEVERSRGESFGVEQRENRKDGRREIPGLETGGSLMQSPASGLLYQIHILGEVRNPGTYRVPASTRLSEAIEIAGGTNSRGSERAVQLRRQGGRRIADLMSFKRFGNLEANPYLLENDVVFVPLKKKAIQIEGAVQRGGVYELTKEKSISDVVRLAGGYTPGASPDSPVKVIRFDGDTKRVIDVENNPSALRSFRVEPYDVIVIPHVLLSKKKFDYNVSKLPGEVSLFYPSYDERVFVLGAVANPGPYPFSPYYDLRQYLTIAGGTTKLAKPKKIRVIGMDGKVTKGKDLTTVNPGDTIVVPEKYMAPESFATLVVGITASIVGITSAIVSLSR